MASSDDVVIVVRGRADRSASQVFDDLGDDARDMARDVEQAAQRAGRDLDEIGQHGQRAGDGMRDIGGSAQDAGGATSGFSMEAIKGLAAVGVAVAAVKKGFEFLAGSIKIADERAQVIGKAGARAGLDPQSMKELGQHAGRIYAQGFGETFEDAATYARDTARFITTTFDPEFEHISSLVGNLSSELEEDSAQVARAIKVMLVTGMAKDATEAADIIQAGINGNVDAADDLLDTFIEYSTQFRQLGITGKEAMGLLAQGLNSGARDADTVADGLKEIAIRAQAIGDPNVEAGFKALGLAQKKLGADFAAGGDRAHSALGKVLVALKAIKDPQQQAAIATQLFGTKAEDLQDALFGLDLDAAGKGFADVAGAADDAAKKMGDTPLAMLKSYQRQWENVQEVIGLKMVPVIKEIQKYVELLAQKIKPYIDEILPALKQYWADNADGVKKFGNFMREFAIPVLGEALGVAIHAAIGVGYLLIAWMDDVGTAWENVKRWTDQAMNFIKYSLGRILDAAVLAFGWMPGIGPKLEEAQRKFHEFADSANDALESIRDRDVIVTARAEITAVNTLSRRASGGYATGLTVVNEGGPELIDFGGSTARVHNAGETRAMLAGGGGGGGPAVVQLVFRDTGKSTLGDMLRQAAASGDIEMTANLVTGSVNFA